ncbi:AmiS/UreI family transporter [Saccharopolyspora erythraea NRRL 2338]|uniref:Amidate substrates transporter protein n=2 Tax=Saccharopolyspora erythraea TaxID=1836 RepID=A4FB17_SACEN|nr:AmiS/UreI family transporter [Saccharopolyspora erythraea]EQD87617.1 transporter [Saccharopolyspora erythraea D]PFG95024.1 AmiS/UreI family transporter [Saccharopolyspora erythraea NRRL 2338]QRK91713.1 AmiS/UreI family transporter [Saccharopolyspora erythraea]CAM01242.1 amidate substrates transporter protein [Saccharopolyspora erythraea NRRL 2338]
MAFVGLLYVGAVLFLNGVMLLGKADPKSIGVFNIFVGALQVVTPTILITANLDDPVTILNASGIYLFGFTYLYVGIGLIGEFDSTGVGWFSLFVAIMALGYSFANFRLLGDAPFGVIWLYWSFLWLLFFLLLGLKMERLTIYTGWVAAIEGWVTAAIPAFLTLTGYWVYPDRIAVALAVFGVVVFAGIWLFTSGAMPRRAARGPRAAPPPSPAH